MVQLHIHHPVVVVCDVVFEQEAPGRQKPHHVLQQKPEGVSALLLRFRQLHLDNI